MHKATWILLTVASVLFIAQVQPVEAGQGHFEVFAGQYFSDSAIDDEPVVGVRGGYRFNDHFGLQGSLGRVELIDPVISVFGADGDGVFFDVSAMWYLNPGKKAEWVLFGGPGHANLQSGNRFRLDLHGDIYDDEHRIRSTDSATLHAGVGVEISFGNRTYLRPMVKARWFEGFSSQDDFLRSDTDVEATVAFGWKWGKP